MSVYNDAQVNVLEEALPFQSNHKGRRIGRKNRNPKDRSYDSMDLTKLEQTLSKICAFYRSREHGIVECPQIDNEVRDGFVKHVRQ
jgi:hypothetical protein